MIANYIYNVLEYTKSTISHILHYGKFSICNNRILSAEESMLMQLNVHGYAILHDYLDRQTCEKLCKTIDQSIQLYPSSVWKGVAGADERIFGVELLGGTLFKFFNDPFLIEIGSLYFKNKLANLLTLANRIRYKPDNIGSGEGWHRDANHFQFKAIVYLTDVNDDNGPFQLIRNSHKYFQTIKDIFYMDVDVPLQTRFTDRQIDTLIARDPNRIVTIKARAGSLILVNTSLIHRGAPLLSDERYAIFNYYYPSDEVEGRKNNFIPRLSKDILNGLHDI
jgi:hypothetical protein